MRLPRIVFVHLPEPSYGAAAAAHSRVRRLAARGDARLATTPEGFRDAFGSGSIVVAMGWRSVELAAGTPALLVGLTPGPARERALAAPSLRARVDPALSRADAHIVTTRAGQRDLQVSRLGPVLFVPPVADIEPFEAAGARRRRRRTRPRLLVVQTGPDPDPSLLGLLPAVARLRARGLSVELRYVVPAPCDARARPPRDALGPGARLIDRFILGVTAARMPALHARADALLAPATTPETSAAEPLLEAMASGLPLVLADAACHRELGIGPGEAAWFDPSDPGSFCEAVERATTDHALRDRLVTYGRSRAKRHTWEVHLEALEAAIDEVRARTSGTRRGGAPIREVHGEDSEAGIRQSRYLFAAQITRGLRVLDLGCGHGEGARQLADAGARSVLAVDRSEIAIAYAKRGPCPPELFFDRMDARQLALAAESMDLVTAFGLLDDAETAVREAIAGEAARVLTARGAFAVSIANPGPDPEGPSLRADAPDALRPIETLLSRHFGRVVVYAQRRVPEGVRVGPGPPDPGSDVGWIVLASQPQPSIQGDDAEQGAAKRRRDTRAA